MNPVQAPQPKRTLLITVCAQAFAVVLYVAVTYLVHFERSSVRHDMWVLVGNMYWVSLLTFAAGLIVERLMLSRAKSAADVQRTGIVCAGLGEAIAVYGLLLFFATHQRVYEVFAISALYFLRLFLRLPEFYQKMDAFTQEM